MSFSSNGVGSLLAATSSTLSCLFLDQNKDYRPEDGLLASIDNVYDFIRFDTFIKQYRDVQNKIINNMATKNA